MAASDKNIIITPNRGGATAEPEIFFGGSGNNPIRLKVLDDSAGTVSFQGAAGSLFSVDNNLTSGSIFTVNDISGIPSHLVVNANCMVSMALFGGNVGIGATTSATSSKLDVEGFVLSQGYRIDSGNINTQTSGYTLVAGDNGRTIAMNSTLSANLTVGTAVGTTGFSCTVIQTGPGRITITGSGTTVNSQSGFLKMAGENAVASIICYGTNTFNVSGSLIP